MEEIYFNTIKFKKAISLIEKDPIGAKILLEDYINEYPKDYNAKTYYTYILIVLNQIDEALTYQDQIENEALNDEIFKAQALKLKRFIQDSHTNKIRILAHQEKYQELYNYINLHKKYRYDNNSLILLCKIKLGLIDVNQINASNYPYVQKQMINYNIGTLKRHIQKHLADFNKDFDNPNKNVFSPDFKINEVLEEIKKYIPSSKRIFTTTISDSYVFKYDDCGRENNKITNYFKVICYHNTDKIITIYPSYGIENIPHVDLNYLIEKPKTKTLSQIEKFNRRFNRK